MSETHRCQRSPFWDGPRFLSPVPVNLSYCGPRFHRLWEHWCIFIFYFVGFTLTQLRINGIAHSSAVIVTYYLINKSLHHHSIVTLHMFVVSLIAVVELYECNGTVKMST